MLNGEKSVPFNHRKPERLTLKEREEELICKLIEMSADEANAEIDRLVNDIFRR